MREVTRERMSFTEKLIRGSLAAGRVRKWK